MYGNTLLAIQKLLIKKLPANGVLLILGGGNGKILPHIYAQSPCIQIIYLEASSKMIDMAKDNSPQGQNIRYIHGESIGNFGPFDYVMVNFFLDLFSPSDIQKIVTSINENQDPKPTLFVADFHIGKEVKYKFIRALQIKLSIYFFRLTTNHSISYLPDVFDILKKIGYKSLYISSLKGNFVRCSVLKLK